jgi:hypothetical protein
VTTAGQGKTTKAAEAPATELALEWDAGTRTLRCGDRVALAVPADLTVYVRKDGGDDVTIVPPGSPPDAALVVTDLGTMSISGDDDPTLQMATAAFGERLDRIANALMTVRGIANGKEPGEPHVYVHNSANGIADATYVLDEAPDILWRLLLFQAGPCLFASVEQVHLDAAQRFAPMLQRMCTASRSSSQTRCQPRPSLTIPVH